MPPISCKCLSCRGHIACKELRASQVYLAVKYNFLRTQGDRYKCTFAHVVAHAHVIAGFQPHTFVQGDIVSPAKESHDSPWHEKGFERNQSPPRLYFSFGGISAPFTDIS